MAVTIGDPLRSTVAAFVPEKDTEEAVKVTMQDGIGQRLEVNFAAPFVAGKYYLLLKTRGYSTPDAEVEMYRKKVTVNPGAVSPTPVITSVQGVGCVNGEIKPGTKFTVKGLNLDKLDLTQSHEFQYKVGGETRLGTIGGDEFTTVTATELVADIALPEDADIGSTVTLTLFFTGGYSAVEGTATVVAA